MTSGPGALYVVATPIGNLEDLTFRALRVLGEVDLIAAEDTRRTSKLLAHYRIRRPLVSLREHNERREAPRLVQKLVAGQQIALVSDAGTPAIADPGARLVRAARAAGARIVPVPGPSAVTAALSVAGLQDSTFTFLGFPPAGGSLRRTWFDRVSTEDKAVVFFEAPHRIRRTLSELAGTLGNRPITVLREISKIHENYVVSPIDSLPAGEPVERGEFTVVIEAPSPGVPWDHQEKLSADFIGRLTESDAFTPGEAERIVAALSGVPIRVAAKIVKKHRILVKRRNVPST